MADSFSCPACGAEYSTDQVSPGLTFTCGSCQEAVTAPAAAEVPATGNAPAAAEATARPSARPAGRGPAARSGAARPPAARPGAGRPAAGGDARRAGGGAGRPRTPAPAKTPGSKKGVIIAAGAVVVIGIVIAVVMSGGDQGGGGGKAGTSGGGSASGAPKGTPAPAPAISDPLADARAAIDAALKKHDTGAADGAWKAAEELRALEQSWKTGGRDAGAVAALATEVERLEGEVLKRDPDHAGVRKARGQRRYEDELAEFTTVEWLPERERDEIRSVHERLKDAAREGGWARADWFKDLDRLLPGLLEKKKEQAELETSPFFTKTKALKQEIEADLDRRFAKQDKTPFSGVVMAIARPFVFFVQKDEGWIPEKEAHRWKKTLKALEGLIRRDYGTALNLKPIEDPVPVLMFRNYQMYLKYSGQEEEKAKAFAHFEPMTGRLAVHDDCDHLTIMHEGTHQLMWAWTERDSQTSANPAFRSYWFQEGIAEWYGGAFRTVKADGSEDYELGRLHMGRIDNIRQRQGKETAGTLFNLRELLSARYLDRPRIEKEGRVGELYGQGWFFIYFMEYFNVDAEGMVKPNTPGKYKEKWMKYVQEELLCRTGPEVFMKTMGFDEKAFDEMETEYWRFLAYILRKINLGEVVDNRPIPWDQKKHKKSGAIVGEKTDDTLPPLDPEIVPPRKRD